MFRKIFLASAATICVATPAMAQSDVTWTGPYVGVSAGLAGDKMKYPVSVDFTPSATVEAVTTAAVSASGPNSLAAQASLTSSGFVGGIVAGYDQQVSDSLVLGIVADISASSTKGTVTAGLDANFSAISGAASAKIGSRLQYLGTVRARVGVPVANNRFMPYVTGGLAYGRIKSGASIDFNGGGSVGGLSGSGSGALGASQKTSHTGWVAGAGAEYAVSKRIHFGVEYLHANLGTKTIIGGSFGTGSIPLVGGLLQSGTVDAALRIKPQLNIVRATVGFRF